ncbi:TPA: hypothetical protein ACGO2R_001082 [Streptococcus suis]|uniref:hypothetical protein n=1 Tax=Streptococcus suis TaxID=1307 RepID=UPI001479540C
MEASQRKAFYQHLAAVYNLPTKAISSGLREQLFVTAQKLDRTDNQYLLADRLGRYVNAELTALTCRAPKELVHLARYIQGLQNDYRRLSLIPGRIE